MTTIVVSQGFDMRDVDFNLQGAGRTVEYIAVRQLLLITSTLGAYAPEQLQLRGTDLSFDAGGQLTGGTLTQFSYIGPYDTALDDPPFYLIRDFALSVETLLTLFDPATGVIDLAGLRAALFGGDDVVSVFGTGAGAEVLLGYGGNDTLTGGDGNDTFYGGPGRDELNGGNGNDFYYVDNALDRVVELAGAGSDTVRSTAGFTLRAQVENLILTGANDIAGTGNGLGNRITGNVGDNRLSGAGGRDTLAGGAGNDTLIGGDGNDRLNGGAGADVLRFVSAPNAASNVDAVTGFVSGTDRLELDDAVFAGIGPVGALAASAFVSGAAATTAAQRVVYDAATGRLSYDADGSGAAAAVLFAQLSPGTALTAADFGVV